MDYYTNMSVFPVMAAMNTTSTNTDDRALVLLGQGIPPERVAVAIGVSVSRISQLVSDPVFAAKISELRFAALSRHNDRDNAYDSIEDDLIVRMKEVLPMMYQPAMILKAISVINQAKRRGQSAPDSVLGTREVVNLTIPSVVLNRVTQNLQVNIHNQVIKAGEQDLVTVQSVRMNDLLDEHRKQRTLALENMKGNQNVVSPVEKFSEGAATNRS